MYEIKNSDCLEALKAMPDNSIDAIVTDPPAGIGFMGKEWDKDKGGRDNWIAWMQEIAAEAFRVAKPGAHALVWALPRTSHWTATAWENAGFEVKDVVAHIFGSGFPKSLDIGKSLDKAAGAEREIIDTVKKMPSAGGANTNEGWKRPWAEGKTTMDITAPATPEAKQWNGWGTALKPAREDWILLRKPVQGTIANNVLKWGTGGINIDGCRVGTEDGQDRSRPPRSPNVIFGGGKGTNLTHSEHNVSGRFPANFIHDGSEEVVGMFPRTTSGGGNGNRRGHGPEYGDNTYGNYNPKNTTNGIPPDSGSAARFFYVAKPSTAERNAGCEELPLGEPPASARSKPADGRQNALGNPRSNHHPTLKSIALMRYLCRLVTPPGGTVLDMFMGSGTTLIAAQLEGFNAVGIEKEEEYFKIAEKRIKHWTAQTTLL